MRMLRRTKIVATLGPATDDPEVLRGMCRAGLDVARLNFSHGNSRRPPQALALLREAVARGRVVGILGDLPAPRSASRASATARCSWSRARLSRSTPRSTPSGRHDRAVGCAYKNLPADVAPGDTLLLNDGLIVLEVTGIAGTRIDTRVVAGGELSNRKGVNRKGGGISAPALTDKDREDIVFAAREELDYVACRSCATPRTWTRRASCWSPPVRTPDRRQDRAPRGHQGPRRHRRCRRRGDGGARRPRRRDGLCGADRAPEDHHPAGAHRNRSSSPRRR
jgi:pyruvate kinase